MKKAILPLSGSIVSQEEETREKDGKVYKSLKVLIFTGEQANYALYLPLDIDLAAYTDKDGVLNLPEVVARDFNSAMKMFVVGNRFELPRGFEYKKKK